MPKYLVVVHATVRREYLVDAADPKEAEAKSVDMDCDDVCDVAAETISITEQ